ncbi:MAG TPA: carbonate dehydratase, partial [Elusimicrobiota bacterium]|nr:carbonate dehydratase [Elusimicrobiota bacterium]
MNPVDRLLQNNRRWAQKVQRQDPTFFKKLSRQQRPHYLWIGCSDSRVPANQITGLLPGDVFVHRNVANLVVHTDLNCLSVIQFAVDVLKVKHIIVCGHYGCGGVGAALRKDSLGLADNWIRHVQDVAQKHRPDLDARGAVEAQVNRLCELNVLEQVANVCQTTVIQDAWSRGQAVAVHGWIYDLADGLIRDLEVNIGSAGEFTSITSAPYAAS